MLVAVGKNEAATETKCKFENLKLPWFAEKLRACTPDIKKVDEEDFTISTASDNSTLAFSFDTKKT